MWCKKMVAAYIRKVASHIRYLEYQTTYFCGFCGMKVFLDTQQVHYLCRRVCAREKIKFSVDEVSYLHFFRGDTVITRDFQMDEMNAANANITKEQHHHILLENLHSYHLGLID